MPQESRPLDARRLTPLDRQHWFGYYDKWSFDASDRRLLCLRTEAASQPLTGAETADVGILDLDAPQVGFQKFDETRAWCWQQSNMLQWRRGVENEIIYNRLDGDRFVSVIRNMDTGASRVLPRPIYCLSPDGRHALSLNFARLAHTRPGYGYPALPDPWKDVMRPDDDGVYLVDLQTGRSRLVVSVRRAADEFPDSRFTDRHHWFNHLLFNTDGSRFAFLHRWRYEGRYKRFTRLMTARPDGTDLRVVSDHEMVSHYDWRDGRRILAWANRDGRGMHYYLFDDEGGEPEIVGEDVFHSDGHCSWSPDRRWVLTDSYPSGGKRALILYRPEDNLRVDVGAFYTMPTPDAECRCDLHPRWSRDGKTVCFDSTHENIRALYLMDVSPIVG